MATEVNEQTNEEQEGDGLTTEDLAIHVRLARMEGAYEHLATKADMHAMETGIRNDMHAMESRILRWMIGLQVGMFAALVGLVIALLQFFIG